MKIAVIGLGYIGLPTAAMFANAGHHVVGVDYNTQIIDALKHGQIIIEEANLGELVRKVTDSGNLSCSLTPQPADVFIIAVPTPIKADKTADMSYVISATESIVPYLAEGNIVILESTSPVGTVNQLMLPILAKSGLEIGEQLYVGHSPERVIPGKILYELTHNSRIAGGVNEISAHKISEVYRSFVQGEIFETDTATAELCKLTENTFRDINIAFANEMAKICENLGINVWNVIELCNKHPRVNIHQPGPGVGGHCIAVDPWFIVEKQPETAKIINLCRHTNDSMPTYVADRICDILKDIIQPKVSILGVTYKPDVDDLRESPILELIEILNQRNYSVSAYDPFITNREDISNDFDQTIKDSDMLVLGVHHQQFKQLPLEKVAKLMRNRLIFDTRNFLDQQKAEAAGFKYYLLGNK